MMKSTLSLSRLWTDNRLLGRLVVIALALVILVSTAFAAYYYWDRYVHLGDQSPMEREIEHLEQLARQNPQDPTARLALAQYYLENGMNSEAIQQAQQVLKAYPDTDGALLILGLAYTRSGQVQEAIEPLEQFAAIRREAPMAHIDTLLETTLYYLGMNYVTLNQPEQAIQVLNEALTINPTDADAMYQLGLAYSLNGQLESAIDMQLRAIRFVPDFLEAYQHLAETYQALDMPYHVSYGIGMQAYANKDYDQARERLEQVAPHLPDFAPHHLGLGMTYEQLGEFQLAKASYERVLELDPNDFFATQALARIERTGQGN